ncbi:MAG: DnrO protein [Xanthomonadales bacterium]|nr:DnrO protein [Xanthomonadales bacterium]
MRIHAAPLLSLGLAFAMVAQAAPPVHEHHEHVVPAGAAAQAPAGGWATDAPLREGMARVKAALADLAHHEMGHMPAEMARERAAEIQDAVKVMFAHCKLEAAPDAALHRILLPLLAAAERLQKDPSDIAAVADMRAAVAPYGREFDDVAWRDAAAATGAHGDHRAH